MENFSKNFSAGANPLGFATMMENKIFMGLGPAGSRSAAFMMARQAGRQPPLATGRASSFHGRRKQGCSHPLPGAAPLLFKSGRAAGHLPLSGWGAAIRRLCCPIFLQMRQRAANGSLSFHKNHGQPEKELIHRVQSAAGPAFAANGCVPHLVTRGVNPMARIQPSDCAPPPVITGTMGCELPPPPIVPVIMLLGNR